MLLEKTEKKNQHLKCFFVSQYADNQCFMFCCFGFLFFITKFFHTFATQNNYSLHVSMV